MSKIGYIRVSTEHQETARQQEIMCDYQVDRIFSEKISGANTDRPQLKAMLDYVREGIEIAKAQGKYTGQKAHWDRLDEVRAALWGMEVEEHYGQGLYAENGYVG